MPIRNLILTIVAIIAQDSLYAAQLVNITVPNHALIDLEGTTSIALAPTGPTEAGNALSFTNSTNNEIWMNISSAAGTLTKINRVVSVQITSGYVPAVMQLKDTAGSYSGGFGQGTLGTLNSQSLITTSYS